MAVHTRTKATRLLLVHVPQVEFGYRYESWVQMASRRPALRVDLNAQAGELTREDGAHGRWRFEGVEHITPRMYREGGESILTPEDIRAGWRWRSGPAHRRGIHTGDERHHAWCRSRPEQPAGTAGTAGAILRDPLILSYSLIDDTVRSEETILHWKVA